MDNIEHDDIKKLLEGSPQSMEAPSFIEDDIMRDIAVVEAKKSTQIDLRKVLIFSGLLSILVLSATVLQFYFPQALWLMQVKLIVALALVLFLIYNVVSWLPSFISKLFTKVL
jgi:hypothetical protein